MERYPKPNVEKHAGVLDRRVEALLIDGLLVSVIVGVLGYTGGLLAVGGSVGGLGGTIVALQFGVPVVLLGYQTVLEGYYGQTIGKYLRGIVVVNEDGSSITWGAAIARNLLRIVDMLPVFYVVGIVVAFITENKQRLGDVAGSTVVVHTED